MTDARQLFADGNYREALALLEQQIVDPHNTGKEVARDFLLATECLQKLSKTGELDALRARAVASQPASWEVLAEVAWEYFDGGHDGSIVAGDFVRGSRSYSAEYVNCYARDRTMALELFVRALACIPGEADRARVAEVHWRFARTLRGNHAAWPAWKLQVLTGWDVLPEFEHGYGYGSRNYHGGRFSLAAGPVEENGKPVIYSLPESFEEASNDGERWRWALERVGALDPKRLSAMRFEFASFLREQFGVQELPLRRNRDWESSGEQHRWNALLGGLNDDESLAHLASGIRRITLPEEAQFIPMFRKIASDFTDDYAARSLDRLAQTYENRWQYQKAAASWEEAILRFGKGLKEERQKSLDQIKRTWGRFDSVPPQAAGAESKFTFRYRNATSVRFTAQVIKFEALFEEIKTRLKSNTDEFSFERMDLSDLCWLVVHESTDRYIGEKLADWSVDLDPGTGHFDRLVEIIAPLTSAGFYLITAHLEDSECMTVLHLRDFIFVEKLLSKRAWYFVANATTGEPVPKTQLEFFGFDHPGWVRMKRKIDTREFTVETDEYGQAIVTNSTVGPMKSQGRHQWFISVRSGTGAIAAFSHFGDLDLSRVYSGEPEPGELKAWFATDRPVYRPGQIVRFHAWIRNTALWPSQSEPIRPARYKIQAFNLRRAKVYEATIKSDSYGGIHGEFVVPEKAPLGRYMLGVVGRLKGGISFSVEEYKKPEFEVTITPPESPPRLGDSMTVQISVAYYFGAPVANAVVRCSVDREARAVSIFPRRRWDWLYGNGYWWPQLDWAWHPGWRRWGQSCPRPRDPAVLRRSGSVETVLQLEGKLDANGQFEMQVDTALAKQLHGDSDHSYSIHAEVTDESRRMQAGAASVLVARQPFSIFVWPDQEFYEAGGSIRARFIAQTAIGERVTGRGSARLFALSGAGDELSEREIEIQAVESDRHGEGEFSCNPPGPGRYRLSVTLANEQGDEQEGATITLVRGTRKTESSPVPLEVSLSHNERAPGEKLDLLINTSRAGGTVLFLLRPSNGIYLGPKLIHMATCSHIETISVTEKDQPNFFVEVVAISEGEVHSICREILVPPQNGIMELTVEPASKRHRPGGKAPVTLRLTNLQGEPWQGSLVVAVYDKALDQIAGGSNVVAIKEFFWSWRRWHDSSEKSSANFGRGMSRTKKGMPAMQAIGVFGEQLADYLASHDASFCFRMADVFESDDDHPMPAGQSAMLGAGLSESGDWSVGDSDDANGLDIEVTSDSGESVGTHHGPNATPLVRSHFADSLFWAVALETGADGCCTMDIDMPENLTTWKILAWSMSHGGRVGEAESEIITCKDLIIRLQAPRFLVEADEVTLSANVHNYLATKKLVRAVLDIDGEVLEASDPSRLSQSKTIEPQDEQRFDWNVHALRSGSTTIRMSALTDEESDAVEFELPIETNGAEIHEGQSGVIPATADSVRLEIAVPSQCRSEASRLEVTCTASLASALIDALPYLIGYPYGCTEQTLSRFLPALTVRRTLEELGIPLEAIKKSRSEQNRQKRRPKAVFSEARLDSIIEECSRKLEQMQSPDGGWGWFGGWGEKSDPHMTAHITHGLLTAEVAGVKIDRRTLEMGTNWLQAYQRRRLEKKKSTSNIDALVARSLSVPGKNEDKMLSKLFEKRSELSVYGLALLGIALNVEKTSDELKMVLRNLSQYRRDDDETQSSYLDLPESGGGWFWHNDHIETQATYLKLLTATNPPDKATAGLAKYLICNRRNASYWNNTRDTALCVDALSDFVRTSGEAAAELDVSVVIDDQPVARLHLGPENLLDSDGALIIEASKLSPGCHRLELRKAGRAPLYFSSRLVTFALGTSMRAVRCPEISIARSYYRSEPVETSRHARGSRGQALEESVALGDREPIENGQAVQSGDVIEIELTVTAENEFEYLLIEDPKLSGCEPMETLSGYAKFGGLIAYRELRDRHLAFFVRHLSRGEHSMSYRLRAETPGQFCALPARIQGMYATGLRANSEPFSLKIL